MDHYCRKYLLRQWFGQKSQVCDLLRRNAAATESSRFFSRTCSIWTVRNPHRSLLNLYEISIENLRLYVGLSSVEFRKLSSLFLYPFAMSITGERHNRKKLKSLRTYVRTPKPPLMLQSFEKSTMTNLLCLIKAYWDSSSSPPLSLLGVWIHHERLERFILRDSLLSCW